MMTSRRFPSLKRRELDLWESSPKWPERHKSCKPWSCTVNKIEVPSWNHCSVSTGGTYIFLYNQFTVLYIYIYIYMLYMLFIYVYFIYIYRLYIRIYIIYIYIYVCVINIYIYIYIYIYVLFKISICALCGWMENLHLGQESPDGQAHME